MDDDVVQKLGHADFHGKSTLHPTAVGLLLFFGFAMLVVPRRHAMIMILACGSFMAVGQRLVIGGLDFNFMRLMVIFGWTRLILRQEFLGFRWNRMDLCFLAISFLEFVTSLTVLGLPGMTWRLGMLFESLGVYFMARILIRDLNDVRALIFDLAVISIPIALIFLIERSTARNLFAVFGGVPEITAMRGGKLRCQGAYSHPILAGCYWAAVFPLLATQIFSKGSARILAILGMLSSLLIIACCASSTPITGLLAGVVGLAMIPLRKWMKWVRRFAYVSLIALHFMKKSPIWHLIARTDFVGGSTGWHRAHLIDEVIAHFYEWALFGTASIEHWTVQGGDICIQYALIVVRSGLLTLILFLLLIALAFGNVGRAWRRVENSPTDVLLIWAIGVSIFVHTVNFIGVAYFGQIDVLWYIGIALATVTPSIRNPGRVVGSTVASRLHPRATLASSALPAGYR